MVIGIPITIYNLVSLRVSPIQSFNPYKSLFNSLIFVGEFDFILKKVDFMLCLTYFYLTMRITTSISNNYGHILFITNNCHSWKSLYFLKLWNIARDCKSLIIFDRESTSKSDSFGPFNKFFFILSNSSLSWLCILSKSLICFCKDATKFSGSKMKIVVRRKC